MLGDAVVEIANILHRAYGSQAAEVAMERVREAKRDGEVDRMRIMVAVLYCLRRRESTQA